MPEESYIFSKSRFMRIDMDEIKGRKTPIFRILESTTLGELGEIKWHAPWREFCFFPEGGCVFDSGCLAKIVDWVRAANEQYKALRAGGKQYGENTGDGRY